MWCISSKDEVCDGGDDDSTCVWPPTLSCIDSIAAAFLIRWQFSEIMELANDEILGSIKPITDLLCIGDPPLACCSCLIIFLRHLARAFWNHTWRTLFDNPVFWARFFRSLASGFWLIAKYDFIDRSWLCLKEVRILLALEWGVMQPPEVGEWLLPSYEDTSMRFDWWSMSVKEMKLVGNKINY